VDGKVVLVTGASRGIGAATAERLAAMGADVVINYRDKKSRAEKVAEVVRSQGREGFLAQADLTDPDAQRQMVDDVAKKFGRLDVLILNASGGMERDVPADYAMRLNRDAQVRMVDLAAPIMPPGSRIVFVTSHQAHFFHSRPTIPEYAPVAASKRAGEDALREREQDLTQRRISLVVVSGDVIEGTITATLLDRARPGLLETRRREAGHLPTVDEFADAVAKASSRPEPPTETVYVGLTS
jgi:NAD(P)-dependent dehydrogenase (short-subunit alcohol dehydrogenase family)